MRLLCYLGKVHARHSGVLPLCESAAEKLLHRIECAPYLCHQIVRIVFFSVYVSGDPSTTLDTFIFFLDCSRLQEIITLVCANDTQYIMIQREEQLTC